MKSKFFAKLLNFSKFAQGTALSKFFQRLPLRKVAKRLRLVKNAKAFRVFAPAWALLTEVPGWPKAPILIRLRRALPIVAPVLGIAAIVSWNHLARLPQIQAAYTRYRPLIDLDHEVAALRLVCSDQQATESSRHSGEAAQLLIEEADLPGILGGLKKAAAERGWEATFQATDHSAEAVADGAVISYLPVRAKLSTKAASGQAFSGLVSFLDQLSSSPKRIDLMRLAIRADEQGRYLVELNLRLACRVAAHEKTS